MFYALLNTAAIHCKVCYCT